MERETGIEPATNSLEGCDSTTELLPPSCSPLRSLALRRGKLRRRAPHVLPARASAFQARSPRSRFASVPRCCPARLACRAEARVRGAAQSKRAISRAKAGGEGRIRTSEAARATDLQSAAFDRSATSPARRRAPPPGRHVPPSTKHPDARYCCVERRLFLGAYLQNPEPLRLELAEGFEPPTG